MAGITVVFDFDRTIIDDDSDRWVVTQMGLTPLFNKLYNTMPWNSLMLFSPAGYLDEAERIIHWWTLFSASAAHGNLRLGRVIAKFLLDEEQNNSLVMCFCPSFMPLQDRMMEELHLQGRTLKDISECLKSATLHPRIIAAIKSAHALGCELIIISDANWHYIETIMEHHGVLECFSQISTNPTFVDAEGRLRISPFHALESPPHGCHLCPSNLCKGLVMEKIRVSKPGKQRFIYLGDGRGDFCPTVKLKEGDFVMPRINYPLWERICNNSSSVRAQIHHWSDGVELEHILLNLINAISTEKAGFSSRPGMSSSHGKCKTSSPQSLSHTSSFIG